MSDDSTSPTVNPWRPMSDPLDLAVLGKFAEELAECAAIVSRCIIQGIEEREPVTGKLNREALSEEIADVMASMGLTGDHFGLDQESTLARAHRKVAGLRLWHDMLRPRQ